MNTDFFLMQDVFGYWRDSTKYETEPYIILWHVPSLYTEKIKYGIVVSALKNEFYICLVKGNYGKLLDEWL